jgi:hypothetical protein
VEDVNARMATARGDAGTAGDEGTSSKGEQHRGERDGDSRRTESASAGTESGGARKRRNAMDLMVGCGMQQAREPCCGGSRRGGEEPRGRNRSRRVAPLDQRTRFGVSGSGHSKGRTTERRQTCKRGRSAVTGQLVVRGRPAQQRARERDGQGQEGGACIPRDDPRGPRPATVEGRGGRWRRPTSHDPREAGTLMMATSSSPASLKVRPNPHVLSRPTSVGRESPSSSHL